jgi:hypothetical protein
MIASTQNPWQDTITQCWTARNECQRIFFGHCLAEGGAHLEENHVRVLMDCIEICQTAADSMVRESPVYSVITAACAGVCESCAENCDSIDSPEMRQLAAACRACADSCRRTSLGGPPPAAVSEESGVRN